MEVQKPIEISDWRARLIFGRRPRRTLYRVLLLVVLSLLFFKFLFLPIRVTGISMAPTYRDRSINFVNRTSYLWSPPKRGDVVGIRSMTGNSLLYLKRIVGLPGETVKVEEGKIKINGQVLKEPYVKFNNRVFPWELPNRVTLAEDEYFVVGDNRGMNVNEHTFGTIHAHRIVGKVLF
jgi:signal peptidase I